MLRCGLRFLSNTSGATIIEYVLICTFVFLVAAAAMFAVGDSSTGSWGNIAEDVDTAMSP